MNKSLSSLFSGNFLIHAGYAAALVPMLYKAMVIQDAGTPVNAAAIEQTLMASAATKASAGSGASVEKAVIVLSIKQPIVKYSDYWMELIGSKTFIRILENFKNDPSVSGVVLDIDSGGGQVYGTGEFYDYIRAYPKPVVTYTDGYMCSAAYYIGNAARYIVANKRADHIGSLGAYAEWVDIKGLWGHFGAKVHSIYATKSTEKNKEQREAEKNNYAPYIEKVLDPIVETFHEDMKATRPNLNEAVFAGGTWSGPEALEMGLVDALGTLDDAILKVYELDEQQSNNQNNNTMNKPRANVQAVLGLGETPLASTPDKGSYLNEEQLDTLEASLAGAETKATQLQTDLDAANASLQTANESLTKAQVDLTAATTAQTAAVDKLLTDAGLPVAGTTDEKYAALTAHYAAFNRGDGASHTNPISKGNNPGASTPSYVDANAAHNKLANQIFNK